MTSRSLPIVLGIALAATATIVVACRDHSTSPGNQAAPPASAAATVDAPATLRQRNTMDWIGVAHNFALAEFLAELQRPGVLSRKICRYMVEFSARDERIPADRRSLASQVSIAARRDIAEKVAAATPVCASVRFASATKNAQLAHLASFVRPTPQSAEAYSLLSQITSAVETAANSYELASRLQPILNAAASLSEVEFATIAATVSVAQSSYEYWQAELPTYWQAFTNDYGACASRMKWSGYSYGYARDVCLSGGSLGGGGLGGEGASWRREWGPRGHARMVVLASSRSASVPQCPTKSSGFSHIAKGDAAGAFGGAFHGAIAGGLAGAQLGAITGAATGSIGAAIGVLWDTLWYCR